MRHKILIAIFAILLIIVVAILASLFGGQSIENISSSPLIQSAMRVAKKATGSENWTSKMADIKTAKHHLPVNELYVQIDLEKNIQYKESLNAPKENVLPKKEFFTLIVNRGDRYSLYCIKQTLNAFSYPYSVVKEKNITSVFVDSEDEKNLHEIAKKLKDYDIKSTIKKVWL